jgi:hypothetical protein
MAIKVRKARRNIGAAGNVGKFYIIDTKANPDSNIVSSGIHTKEAAEEEASYWRIERLMEGLAHEFESSTRNVAVILTKKGTVETMPVSRLPKELGVDAWLVCLFGNGMQWTPSQLRNQFFGAWESRRLAGQ